MRCELCGRPAKALVKCGVKRSRKARAGTPRTIKGHSVCQQCFESMVDADRAAKFNRAIADLLLIGHGVAADLAQGEAERLLGVIRTARTRLEAGDNGGALDALKEAA